MADTNWGDFTDVASLLDTDVLLAMRGFGGINFPASALVRYAANGNVGIGTIEPDAALHVIGSIKATHDLILASGGATHYVCRPNIAGKKNIAFAVQGGGRLDYFTIDANQTILGGDLHFIGQSSSNWKREIQFRDGAGGLKWSLGADIGNNGSNDFFIWDAAGGVRLKIDSSISSFMTHILPAYDASYNVGWADKRFSNIYAVSGTINTSDQREKVWIGIREDSRAVWLRIARRIFGELGFYQWAAAVEEKGEDGARWHFGARAQRVWQIVADEGLAPPLVDGQPDPAWTGPPPPAFLCFDQWEPEHREEPVYSATLVDEDGEPLQTGTRAVVSQEAGNRFGFRIDQLGLLLDWSLHERLAALEGASQ